MLEGRIIKIMQEAVGSTMGVTLEVRILCHNRQFKNPTQRICGKTITKEDVIQEQESDEEYKKRRLEWEHLHIGNVQINQSD